MSVSEELLELLACPKCKGELTYRPEEQVLECPSCRLRYRIEEDIPVMLIEEAESF